MVIAPGKTASFSINGSPWKSRQIFEQQSCHPGKLVAASMIL